MKLGEEFPQEWRQKAKKDGISLSDILYGQAVEDIMYRISNSSFQEYLWLTNEDALGETSYKRKSKEHLNFLYLERDKKSYKQKICAGDSFGKEIVELFMEEVFHSPSNFQNEAEVYWEYKLEDIELGIKILLLCNCMEIKIPLTLSIKKTTLNKQKPKKRELKTLFENKQKCFYFSYAKENIISEQIFEIMSKLELISNMEAYGIMNEILKTQPVSGRHIIENLKQICEKDAKVITEKRLKQIESYKNYGYMKKRWQQYVRVYKTETESWEEAMDRILTFLGPIWNALCKDEIFLADWMPELKRFLD